MWKYSGTKGSAFIKNKFTFIHNLANSKTYHLDGCIYVQFELIIIISNCQIVKLKEDAIIGMK